MSAHTDHIIPLRTYFIIFALLMVGTLLTVQAAYIDMGPLNSVVAMTIAVTKAVLVVLFFMHAKYSNRLTQTVIIAGVFWLILLLALTMMDYLTRQVIQF